MADASTDPAVDEGDGAENEPIVLATAPPIREIEIGMRLPTRHHTPTNVSLFLYNAAVWNPHRIHYDETYATEVEGHRGVVVDGPLQGDWITQVVVNWLGPDDELVRFGYSNRAAAHLGETLTSGGEIVAVDLAASLVQLDLHIMNETGDVITPGTATVFLAG